MNKLNQDQKNKVNEFKNLTSWKENLAIDHLKKFNWNLDNAVNDAFDNPPADAIDIPKPSANLDK